MTTQMTSQEFTAGQVLVQALLGENVDMIFGISGSHILGIYDALADAPAIRHITAKHENNAALMAYMYGRLTGRPGVCLVTAGPGATNSLTGVAQAYNSPSPVVHISGAVPPNDGKEALHGVDNPDFTRKMFEEVTKWSVAIHQTQEIPEVFAKAFSIAVSGRPGPVHIEIPWSLLRAEPTSVSSYQPKSPESQIPDARLMNQMVGVLRASERPVISTLYTTIPTITIAPRICKICLAGFSNAMANRLKSTRPLFTSRSRTM